MSRESTPDGGGYSVPHRGSQRLTDVGYHPLLEASPARRGGHLWLIFDDLIDVRAARHHGM